MLAIFMIVKKMIRWWWRHLAWGNLGEHDEDDDYNDVHYCHLAIGLLGEYDWDDDYDDGGT